MVLKHMSRLILVLAVSATGYSFSPPPAAAGQVQLHELLFNRAKRQRVREQRVQRVPQTRQVEVRRSAPRQLNRVTGPTYYTYAAPAIGAVTLASLLPDVNPTGSIAGVGAGAASQTSADPFVEALEHVPDTALALEPAIADAMRAHYAENPAFLWVEGMRASARASELVGVLAGAGGHGLDPAHYAVDMPAKYWSLNAVDARHGELVTFELALTARAIRYAMDMKDGAVDPNKLSGYHDFSKDRLTPAAALIGLARTDDPLRWLGRLEPRQAQYAALRSELERLQSVDEEPIVIPDQIFMRPGDIEPALPMVMRAVERRISEDTRLKHASTLSAYSGATLYDGALVDLMRDAQRDLRLVPDGIVGPRTAAALATASQQNKIEMVKLALERLRWHPEEYGERHVVINQPEYRVRYVARGVTELSMRAIVGKPSNQTYFFHDEIDHVVYDPYWGVPQSIIVNKYLPKLWRDPGYLDRNGFVVTNQSGRRVASASVNWRQFNGKVPYNVRQKPGPQNALGTLKIMFPNRHSIYMHDTPDRHLFDDGERAFSAGCVRLQDPHGMAAAVLGKSVDHVRAQLGGGEQVERLAERVPVYVSYYTAWPSDSGEIDYHPDVYDRDDYLGRALDTISGARTI